MTGLALTLCFRAGDQWTDNYPRDVGRAEGIVKRALIIQPENPMLHYAYACVFNMKNSFRAAITENEAAIALDRNLAYAYGLVQYAPWAGRGAISIAEDELRSG